MEQQQLYVISATGKQDSAGTPEPTVRPTSEALELVSKRAAYESYLVPLRIEGRKLVCLGRETIHPEVLRRFEQTVCREVAIIPTSHQIVTQALQTVFGPPEYVEAIDLVEAVATRKPTAPNFQLHENPRQNPGPMKIIAVTSGKGGVGKSSVTANLALSLAMKGFRVGIMDCDFGLSNMHVLLGSSPKASLADVLHRKVTLDQAFELSLGGVFLLSGPTGSAELADLDYFTLQKSGAGFSEVGEAFDYLLLDTGAGTHDGVMSLLMAADEVILVTTPDPAAISDAYVTIRTLFQRRPQSKVHCIVNQVQDVRHGRLIFAKLMTFLKDFADANVTFMGKVRMDRNVVEGGRMRVPVVLSEPDSDAARDLTFLACRMAGVPCPSPDVKQTFFQRILGRKKSA
ncbi:MAG: P-loop NTPase [Armatimonadetes bacterium]|nr:P-loop NTPase [Armatimonadota bacterium]